MKREITKVPILVSYYDGLKTRWARLCARGEDEIRSEFPELEIHRYAPPQMTFTVESSPGWEGEIDIDRRDIGLLCDIIRRRTQMGVESLPKPGDIIAYPNAERIDLIEGCTVGDIISPPGHTSLRNPGMLYDLVNKIRDRNFAGWDEKILLNLFPLETDGELLSPWRVHCIDGTHRLVAGLIAEKWQSIADIRRDVTDELLEVWIEGWGPGDQTGPRPRWIPLGVVQDQASHISTHEWKNVSDHPSARGDTAEIRGDIPNDSLRIAKQHRGLRIERLAEPFRHLGKPPSGR